MAEPTEDCLPGTKSRKLQERRLGFVADYCVICRDVAQHALLCGSKGRNRWTVSACCGCGLRNSVDLGAYGSYVASPAETCAELLAKTNALLPWRAIERASYDNALIGNATHPEDRSKALREPFYVCEYVIRLPSDYKSRVLVWCIAALFIASSATTALAQVRFVDRHMLWVLGGLSAAVLVVPTLLELRNDRRRKARFVAMVARSLRPLRPNKDELAHTLRMLKPSGRAPQWLNEQRLYEAISPLRDTSFHSMSYSELAREADRLREQHDARLRSLAETGSGTPENHDASNA